MAKNDQLSLTHPHDAYITANMLQTMMDAEYDELMTARQF